jgi:hypothetical protein
MEWIFTAKWDSGVLGESVGNGRGLERGKEREELKEVWKVREQKDKVEELDIRDPWARQ